MATVEALFRYPVKGFTPEALKQLVVQSDGRVEGDRVLAFRFADAVDPEDDAGLEYWPKKRGLALMDMPSLARLRLEYDRSTRRLRISDAGTVLVEAGLDPDGRAEIEDAVTRAVAAGPDARRLRGEGRLPLTLIGDGVTSRFQDRARGYISLHGSASVAELDKAADPTVDHRRFRSNIVVSGLPAWSEVGWDGVVRIGELRFTIAAPIRRCAAIMANPDDGTRDVNLLRVLTDRFDQEAPTLGILLLPVGGGGTIRVGDPVDRE
ncbi:MOSC domain-containing protein [Microbacterium schleiferi]|uniref:MOSC domain-containing protein n=1 Tax=Microbacterium schleiferi TaxID=69362 RepID=A0A7S8MVF1_9MICO|nr:MOSC domain-containing protein [Microbacterium schleiferi]QPE03979.1 MOSC domain-containing protein [Microbacterium schleiferi]